MRLRHLAPLLCAAAMLLILGSGAALAKSSLGLGSAEAAVQPGGMFGGFFTAIAVYQREFFVSLRQALIAMKQDPQQLSFLVALSFAYGVFHAAGPGHGKAVISSYMLANEVQLRRGVLLSFVSAMLQAAMALAVVGAGWFLLRGSAVSMTDVGDALEIASYGLIAAFGGFLLARKLGGLVKRRRAGFALDFAPAFAAGVSGGAGGSGAIMRPASQALEPDFCADNPDCDCGRPHMPEPGRLGSERLTWSSAGSAVLAVGLRPCSGAIVVLTFSLMNGLYLGGVLSVLAMALGTAITVSAIAAVAVFAKGAALRLAGGGGFAPAARDGLEILGALLLVALGVTLLGGALQV